jgi:hypothetical protein
MSFAKIAPGCVTVYDFHSLTTTWALYRDPLTLPLVGSFKCEFALTPSQLRRLPAALRARIVQVPSR